MKKHPTLPLWATEDGKVYGPRGLRNPRVDRYGYLRLNCVLGKRRITVAVHRVVAEVFLGIVEGMTVNHRNGNKLDNHIENLEYLTSEENTSHSFKYGMREFCHPVVVDGITYYSRREMERKTGISRHG